MPCTTHHILAASLSSETPGRKWPLYHDTDVPLPDPYVFAVEPPTEEACGSGIKHIYCLWTFVEGQTIVWNFGVFMQFLVLILCLYKLRYIIKGKVNVTYYSLNMGVTCSKGALSL